MSDTTTDDTEQFLQWLDGRIEDSRESYKRDTNARHTSISIGKIRAYKHVRQELIDQLVDTGTERYE